MSSDPSPSTRTAAAVAVAACPLTIAVGVTVAALSGRLTRPPATAAAPPMPASVAPDPASSAGGAVVLVPVEPAVPAVVPESDDPGLRFASARGDEEYEERGERPHREEHDDDDD